MADLEKLKEFKEFKKSPDVFLFKKLMEMRKLAKEMAREELERLKEQIDAEIIKTINQEVSKTLKPILDNQTINVFKNVEMLKGEKGDTIQGNKGDDGTDGETPTEDELLILIKRPEKSSDFLQQKVPVSLSYLVHFILSIFAFALVILPTKSKKES